MPGSDRQIVIGAPQEPADIPASNCKNYPHVYINLDRHQDRAQTFETVNQREMEVCSIQRIQGIDGPAEYEESKPDELKRGEKGCIASHKKAWQHIVDSGASFGVVFEDDAQLLDGYLGASDAIMAEAADTCSKPLVYLDRTLWTDASEEPEVSTHLRRVKHASNGTHAYVISSEAAQFLGAQDIDKPLDHYFSTYIDSDELCLLRTAPSVASVPTSSYSSTQEA